MNLKLMVPLFGDTYRYVSQWNSTNLHCYHTFLKSQSKLQTNHSKKIVNFMLPREINSYVSKSHNPHHDHMYFSQHDNEETSLWNIVVIHGYVIFKNHPLINEKILWTRKDIFALDFLNLLLEIYNLQTTIDAMHVQVWVYNFWHNWILTLTKATRQI
jgi:hypothetical protein